MNTITQNGINKQFAEPAFVLDEYMHNDVGRALIENGRQKQSFFIFDIDEAYHRIQRFRELMPRIRIFYAMRSNDTEIMLKFAISQGLGFDCTSPREIYKLKHHKVNPKDMIYTMPIKTPEQMVYARQMGVTHTTFDSAYELMNLKKYWPDARLLIRIRANSDNQIEFGHKFGCDFESEAINLLKEAACLGLNVVGVSFHIDPERKSVQSYITELKRTRALFDYEASSGRKMKIVDIGDFLSDSADSINNLSKLINDALEDLFPDPEIQIFAEPGACISGSAFTLYCNISDVRRVKKDGKFLNMVYVNDGIYGTMRETVTHNKISKFQRSTEKDVGALEDTMLWGPSCDSLDENFKDCPVKLPRCSPLDWLIIKNHGAYTLTTSTRFSRLEIPLIRPVISTGLWLSIKDNTVFSSADFVVKPDISTPLPITLPSLIQRNTNVEHTNLPILKI